MNLKDRTDEVGEEFEEVAVEKAPMYLQVRVWGCIVIGSLGFWALVIRQLASLRGW